MTGTRQTGVRVSNLQPFCYLKWLAGAYSAITRLRNSLYDTNVIKASRIAIPVISIGNLSAGGTGKTPLVIKLAMSLHNRGYRPVVLSRGYGGACGQHPEKVTENAEHLMYGDEPVLMARTLPKIPVVVARDRVAGVSWITKELQATCVILDDGFQHRRLARDLDIVILDARYPVTEERHLPSGRLRENISGLARADMIVFSHTDTSSPAQSDLAFLKTMDHPVPVFYSRHVPVKVRPVWNDKTDDTVNNKVSVGLISAIGSPAGFKSAALKKGLNVIYEKHFRDHKVLTGNQWLREIQKAKAMSCEKIVITAKDESRFPRKIDTPLPVSVLDITIEIDQYDKFMSHVLSLLKCYELQK
jgi:tetraacyldisaccharide 4'-kinase